MARSGALRHWCTAVVGTRAILEDAMQARKGLCAEERVRGPTGACTPKACSFSGNRKCVGATEGLLLSADNSRLPPAH